MSKIDNQFFPSQANCQLYLFQFSLKYSHLIKFLEMFRIDNQIFSLSLQQAPAQFFT